VKKLTLLITIVFVVISSIYLIFTHTSLLSFGTQVEFQTIEKDSYFWDEPRSSPGMWVLDSIQDVENFTMNVMTLDDGNQSKIEYLKKISSIDYTLYYVVIIAQDEGIEHININSVEESGNVITISTNFQSRDADGLSYFYNPSHTVKIAKNSTSVQKKFASLKII
jgi:hypothetical protein